MPDEQQKSSGATASSSSSGGSSSGSSQSSAKKSGDSGGSGGGPRSGVEQDRRLRTGAHAGTATEAAAAEYEELGVDVRLDNRVGDQRPVLNPVLKPQQFDGPEVGHFGEHADELRDEFKEAISGPEGDKVGMRSLGPIGRGEDVDESADQPQRSRAELGR